jgi:transposase
MAAEQIHCGCWDHARRPFYDAAKAGANSLGIASIGLTYIQDLYEVERREKESSPERRLRSRQLYSRGILSHLKRWLDGVINTVPPKTLAGKALYYLNSEWYRLIRFLDDGNIPISNALAENAIRPFAIGRKNWLFSDTRGGADASAILYSIIETAKANGHEPYEYLSRVIAAIPSAQTAEQIQVLLP